MTVAFFTLGCKLNQYESDALASEFRQAGFTVVEAVDGAEICIINSCTVTNRADRKSRNLVNRAGRQLGSARLLVVTGCFAEDAAANPAVPEASTAPGIPTLWVDNNHKSRIFDLVMDHPAVRAVMAGSTSVSHPAAPGRFAFRGAGSGFHTRATLKIQDGCDAFCSYCIIPSVRGPAQSRPAAEIVSEIRGLCGQGFREIVLTGVNMSQWLAEAAVPPGEPVDFYGLVKTILDLDLPTGQDFRLRLSSLEPEGLDPGFASLFNHRRLCPSLHLCLQSGSPQILTAMKRNYGLEDFRGLVQSLRAVDPDFCLSTDLITGFPGETESQFAASLEAIKEFDFRHVHVFPFSRRRGTAADRLPDQLSDRLKDARAARIRADDRLRLSTWQERLKGPPLGKPLILLVEGIKSEIRHGQAGYRLTGLNQYGLPGERWLASDEIEPALAALPAGPRRQVLPPGLHESGLADQPVIGLWNQFITQF